MRLDGTVSAPTGSVPVGPLPVVARYSVCFTVDEERPGPLGAPHPFKVVVECQ